MREYRVVQVFGLNSVELQQELNDLAEEGFALTPHEQGNFLIMEKVTWPEFGAGPGTVWQVPDPMPCLRSMRPTYGDLDEEYRTKPVPDEPICNRLCTPDTPDPYCPVHGPNVPRTTDGSCGGCNSSDAVPHIPSCPRYRGATR